MTVGQDLRHGLRLLVKSPGFTAAAVGVLALGIGANATIFSLVNAVLLRPLPYPDPSRLVRVWHTPPASSFPGRRTFAVSPANYLDWRSQNHVFSSIAIDHFTTLNLTGMGQPEAIQAAEVSREYFAVLGAAPLLGRGFTAEEEQPGGGPAIILSHALWQTRFGADRRVVGREIRLNDQPYRVVGVMGPRVRMPGYASAWVPMVWDAERRAQRANHNCSVIARLAPGVDLPRAQSEMDVISARLARQYPEDDSGWGAYVVPLHADLVGEVRPILLVLLGAVAFVLLIACANVANLVLARTLARRKEIAIRSALGASRRRLLQELVTETVLLAACGGALGLFLATFGAERLAALLVNALPRSTEIHVDAAVLAFTFVVSVATGVLAGVAPAWRLTRADVAGSLKEGAGRTDADGGSSRARTLLVVSEVALSLVLLIGAGLLIKSLWLLQRVDPGFDPHDVVRVSVVMPKTKYPGEAQQTAFVQQLLDRLRALPGAESVGAASDLPLTGTQNWPIAIEGRPPVPISQQPNVVATVIAGDYLRTLRIRLLRGRPFNDVDRPDSSAVILVSESMAKKFWPGEDAVGKRLTATFLPDKTREVVGIVGDVKLQGLDVEEAVPAMYLPNSQLPQLGLDFAIRTKRPGLVSAAVAAVRQVDPDQPVLQAGTQEEVLAESLSPRRFAMSPLAAFAMLALLLAAIGIYSVLSYAVRRRGREIGIRMALGAQMRDVLRMIVVQGMRPALAGVGIGMAAAFALSRVLSRLVYRVSPSDPATIASVAVLLSVVALTACVVPARRATRVDPIRALREE